MLNKGIIAPDFELQDQNGNIHTLKEFAGKKVLLYFYPKDNTSGCTLQAIGYSELIDEFISKNVVVIGVSKDSIESHKKFECKQNLNITLLSDTDRKTIEEYDVWKEKTMCGKTSMGVVRTTYVISESGQIIFANDKVKAAKDPQSMLEIIDTL